MYIHTWMYTHTPTYVHICIYTYIHTCDVNFGWSMRSAQVRRCLCSLPSPPTLAGGGDNKQFAVHMQWVMWKQPSARVTRNVSNYNDMGKIISRMWGASSWMRNLRISEGKKSNCISSRRCDKDRSIPLCPQIWSANACHENLEIRDQTRAQNLLVLHSHQ